jgi:hypothetical protein
MTGLNILVRTYVGDGLDRNDGGSFELSYWVVKFVTKDTRPIDI